VTAIDGPTLSRAESADDVRSPAAGEVHVWYVDIDSGALSSAADLLSPDEVERARRFHFERDRRRFILARAALRRRLGSYLGGSPQDVHFAYGANGKPVLSAPADPELRFNVSHSGGRALLGFTCGGEVGVDLERLVAVPDALDLAARFFAPAERTALETVEPDLRSRAFLNGWTRKEAFVKALGEGLGFPLDRFEVSLHPDEPARLLALGNGDPTAWTLSGLEPEVGYLAAIAVRGRGYEVMMCGSPTNAASAQALRVSTATPSVEAQQ